MPRRLARRRQQPSEQTDSASSPAPSSTSDPTLPVYQPPSCPLSNSARSALGALSNQRKTLVLETQLRDSIRYLGLSVGDLHERLRAQQERLRRLRQRREDKGTDKSAEENRLEKHLETFEEQVEELTHESEQSLRDVIDHRAELQDAAQVLGELYTTAEATRAAAAAAAAAASTSRRRARDAQQQQQPQEGEDADQKQDIETAPSTRDAYLDARDAKRTQYQALTHHQRYALNNDYAGFKKIWHDAAAGEDGPPLPDASRWFRSDGRPVMTRPGAANTRRSTLGAAQDYDDDDDLAVAREVLSLNCPLTLRQMEEPYSNIKCKHTFEKAAILDYLPATGSSQCPQTGCSQTFSKARFGQEFYLDEAMLRRIQRANQNPRALNHIDDDDDDGIEDDQTLVMGEERPAPGRTAKLERV
ncbi:Zinc finger, RING/FYVE/PHD-type [Moelleriella libera RCEF 2490]|uniref:Zinc finger, RING/FYVE/PHD-type n=1 Tax=Moelleriella libera RCEF 2490 TaxID=1081109 RepID=A0A168DAG4_9HYPO|nr:Zinc finger, RING/FYVE/PHD-type [Moelleriella libera RCEF 2490]